MRPARHNILQARITKEKHKKKTYQKHFDTRQKVVYVALVIEEIKIGIGSKTSRNIPKAFERVEQMLHGRGVIWSAVRRRYPASLAGIQSRSIGPAVVMK